MNWLVVLRWLHVATGAAWLGEVVAVNFVLVPALVRASRDHQRWMLAHVFPRVFNLASWLAASAVIFGALLNLHMTDWRFDWDRLTSTRWGWSILAGGALGLVLTLFHFVIEGRLEPVVTDDETEDATIDAVVHHLRRVPRYGLGVLVIVFGSMMYAAKGF